MHVTAERDFSKESELLAESIGKLKNQGQLTVELVRLYHSLHVYTRYS